MSDGDKPVPTTTIQFGDATFDEGCDRAKTITLFVNGDEHFYGKTLVVNRKHMQTWDTFLKHATDKTGLMFPARNILTPTHGTKITSFDDLMDGSSYVVLAKGTFKPIG